LRDEGEESVEDVEPGEWGDEVDEGDYEEGRREREMERSGLPG